MNQYKLQDETTFQTLIYIFQFYFDKLFIHMFISNLPSYKHIYSLSEDKAIQVATLHHILGLHKSLTLSWKWLVSAFKYLMLTLP